MGFNEFIQIIRKSVFFKGIIFGFVELFFSICIIYVIILGHLKESLENLDLVFSIPNIFLVIVLCTHPILSRTTSLTMQGIESLYYCCLIREFSSVRTFIINRYIWWFWFHPYMWVLNALAFIACLVLYALIIAVTILLATSYPSSAEIPFSDLKFPIWGTITFLDFITAFYIANLGYATWKRIGVFCSRIFLVDCIFGDCVTYAKVFNYILSETQVNFRMDTHMIPDDKLAEDGQQEDGQQEDGQKDEGDELQEDQGEIVREVVQDVQS